MTKEHTPTPWILTQWPEGSIDGIPAGGFAIHANWLNADRFAPLVAVLRPEWSNCYAKQNGELIVRAVNSFDAMKAACESTLAYIENHFGMSPEGQAQRNAARDQLRAALALAERGEK